MEMEKSIFYTPTILLSDSPVFKKTGNIEHDKALACADGLGAWAWVMAGNTPPEYFGWNMVKLGEFLGCLPTAESLSEYAKQNGFL
ncbi:hypothetical protein [Solidesulfovibrio sp. C21]|uniref:hypothetical protein n=1 Tax=Solidesulfovibrio sp. C21 TaxID=3398613 RepID=UPI0039FBEBCD